MRFLYDGSRLLGTETVEGLGEWFLAKPCGSSGVMMEMWGSDGRACMLEVWMELRAVGCRTIRASSAL